MVERLQVRRMVRWRHVKGWMVECQRWGGVGVTEHGGMVTGLGIAGDA